jgi:uncharacterized membrane protein YeaQ/YmgE (transglycosylase-associated protein family)
MELTMQMLPMLILAALLCGVIAESALTTGSYGLPGDMAVTLVGSLAAGALFWTVINNTAAAMLAMFLIGCAGAALAIAVQRTFRRSPRLEA